MLRTHVNRGVYPTFALAKFEQKLERVIAHLEKVGVACILFPAFGPELIG